MALKKSSAITTFKGESLSKIDKYVKLDKATLVEENCGIKPTDIAEGQSADYGKFIILIDDCNMTYLYVPSVDVDYYSELADDDKKELTSGEVLVSIIAKENKKGNTYYITEIN